MLYHVAIKKGEIQTGALNELWFEDEGNIIVEFKTKKACDSFIDWLKKTEAKYKVI